MAQRQCLKPFRCLATSPSHPPRSRSNLLQRSAQCRRFSGRPTESSRIHSLQCTQRRTYSITQTSRRLQNRELLPSPVPISRCRTFTTTPSNSHGDLTPPKPGEERHVTFVDKEGQSHTFEVSDGDNLLDIAQANDLEMEGACGGSCACSTCHVIVESEKMYDEMEEPSDDENDMLDLAFGLTETSRLGCQVQMSKELDGLVVKLPAMTRNMQASDFEKK